MSGGSSDSDSPQPSSSYPNDIYFYDAYGTNPWSNRAEKHWPICWCSVLLDAILDLNEMTMYDAYKDEMFRLKAKLMLFCIFLTTLDRTSS